MYVTCSTHYHSANSEHRVVGQRKLSGNKAICHSTKIKCICHACTVNTIIYMSIVHIGACLKYTIINKPKFT